MKNSDKEIIEKKFQELEQKANELYPYLTEAVNNFNELSEELEVYEQYLELTTPPLIETTNNHILML